jgi:hypothetical protein
MATNARPEAVDVYEHLPVIRVSRRVRRVRAASNHAAKAIASKAEIIVDVSGWSAVVPVSITELGVQSRAHAQWALLDARPRELRLVRVARTSAVTEVADVVQRCTDVTKLTITATLDEHGDADIGHNVDLVYLDYYHKYTTFLKGLTSIARRVKNQIIVHDTRCGASVWSARWLISVANVTVCLDLTMKAHSRHRKVSRVVCGRP